MLQYLVIQLDDTSTSYCHYGNPKGEKCLIPLETLQRGILFGMKENLSIQMVYPSYAIPEEYSLIIDSVDCVKIKPVKENVGANVIVFNDLDEVDACAHKESVCYILRIDKETLFNEYDKTLSLLERAERLNVVLTDSCSFNKDDFARYENVLRHFGEKVRELYSQGKTPQCNILTDRIMLSEMNNCGAGETSITLAPDGRFYPCPAFYLCDCCYALGDIEKGLSIRNPQLYRLDHAPVCRNCDAYQCHRCIWLNRKTTLEVNTPSHEQCVIAHIERNASRMLQRDLAKSTNVFSSYEDIKEINYLDPFEIRKEWKEK